MKLVSYIFLFFSICSCGGESTRQNENVELEIKQSNENIKIDSHFVLRDIKDLNFIDSLDWDFPNLYLDKSKNQKFEKLNNDQKINWLSVFLKAQDGKPIDSDWIKNDWQAFIIAKQTRINNFEPTIVKVYGTDFTAVVLVNLDNNNKVISGFPIYDTENSGPAVGEDTIIITRPKVKCSFRKNDIRLYKLTGICYPKSGDISLFTIDSVTYELTINSNGNIQNKKLDSTRYKKECQLEYFQSY